MTGAEFAAHVKALGFTQQTLADRWRLSRTTISRIYQSNKVEPVYSDAIRFLMVKRQVKDLSTVVNAIPD